MSRKQEIYSEMLFWALPNVRNKLSDFRSVSFCRVLSSTQQYSLRSAYELAELVHNLPKSIAIADFVEHDIWFLNVQARSFLENNDAQNCEHYALFAGYIQELFRLVPAELAGKLKWVGPCGDFSSAGFSCIDQSTVSIEEITLRLNSINWLDYSHPCYPRSNQVATSLLALFDEDPEHSYEAASDLWNSLAHQGNVGSNSVPALPFLIQRIQQQPSLEVLQELAEILYYFSYWLEPPEQAQAMAKDSANSPDDYQWTYALRQQLLQYTTIFQQLASHSDETVADYANATLKNLSVYES